VRHGLDAPRLADLFRWSEEEFLRCTEGSAMRRVGYERWLRNLAVALGNAPPTAGVIDALRSRENDPSELVREHVRWALEKVASG
jgi:epoxyqueuosine reductase